MLAFVPIVVAAQASPLALTNLRCEYRIDPLGVDTSQPRLSWNMTGDRQTAYEVQVASSPAKLADADLWDSKVVHTDACIQIPYSGKPLTSGQTYWWRVRAWDGQGRPSEWSKPAQWTMGLLEARDWKARWIAYGVPDVATTKRLNLEGARWIWSDSGDPRVSAPRERIEFVKIIDTPRMEPIVSAYLVITADNEFEASLNGKAIGTGDNWRNAYRFDVARLLASGKNTLTIRTLNTIPSPAGLVAKLIVRFKGKPDLTVISNRTWTARRIGPTRGNAGPAKEIAKFGDAPWTNVGTGADLPVPLLRREFTLRKPVRRALFYVCGLGAYDAYLNGRKVGDYFLDPGWTDYRKRCLYSTFDVTGQLRQGPNALGLSLGNSMYNVSGARYARWVGSFGPPMAIGQLDVEFTDGSRERIVTDGTWRGARSPITFSSIYGGEDFDARLEPVGWTRPSFAKSWRPVTIVDGPGGKLVSESAPPLKVEQEFPALRITHPKPGIAVYDLGQNMSARPWLRVSGPRGAVVKMTPAELLGKDGLVDQGSGGGGPTYYTYTLKGTGDEVWAPQFSYYGFRYVQVETKGNPLIKDLKGQFTYASAETVGGFQCSNPLVNRIHRLILASIRSNLQFVLTDCPHREKLGWLEVSQLLGPAMIDNYDLAQFYAKVQNDIADAQRPNGLVPDIAPEYTVMGGGLLDSPEWGSASVINPWNMYRRYGDTRVFEQHYGTMARYVRYLQSRSKGGIVSHGLGDWYDVGPGPLGESQLTSRGVTGTVTYFQDLIVMATAARLIGKTADAKEWEAMAQDVRDAFVKQFVDPITGKVDRGSQTDQAMPLTTGMLPPEVREKALQLLVDSVKSNKNRVTAGDVGFTYLVKALTNGGRSDVVFDMVTQQNGPGYWYQLEQGATSLTEAWNAEKTSSWNHCMLGHAEEWFYTGLGGINPDPAAPAFKRFVVRPEPVGDLKFAHCAFRSPYGLIRSDWTIKDGLMNLKVTVPYNTTARIEVPTPAGTKVDGTPGFPQVPAKAPRTTFEVGGGVFEFRVTKA